MKAKHKSGYNLLKEKYAELEKERNKWKEKSANSRKKAFFLWHHSPFWVRWMYRKQFEKGGKE